MLVNLKGGKWYKLLGGNLINFDTSLEIVCVGTKVIVSYSSLDRNQPRGKAYCENAALNYVINGGKRFGYQKLKEFNNDAAALKYIEKLAKKLKADEI